MIGVATGCDLEYADDPSPGVAAFVTFAGEFTTWVFTCECALKIVAEGYKPGRYFTDPENGNFNCFDFSIVAVGWVLTWTVGGSSLGGLRMLRLVRLLTFVKGVRQLRVIVAGLLAGFKSVIYIMVLLILLIYIAAILACMLFGANDPV